MKNDYDYDIISAYMPLGEPLSNAPREPGGPGVSRLADTFRSVPQAPFTNTDNSPSNQANKRRNQIPTNLTPFTNPQEPGGNPTPRMEGKAPQQENKGSRFNINQEEYPLTASIINALEEKGISPDPTFDASVLEEQLKQLQLLIQHPGNPPFSPESEQKSGKLEKIKHLMGKPLMYLRALSEVVKQDESSSLQEKIKNDAQTLMRDVSLSHNTPGRLGLTEDETRLFHIHLSGYHLQSANNKAENDFKRIAQEAGADIDLLRILPYDPYTVIDTNDRTVLAHLQLQQMRQLALQQLVDEATTLAEQIPNADAIHAVAKQFYQALCDDVTAFYEQNELMNSDIDSFSQTFNQGTKEQAQQGLD